MWNNQTGSIGENKMWNFLKEISTNGDMQTMDVVYPASPLMLYTNPELLRLLLIPVLNCKHTNCSLAKCSACTDQMRV